MRSDTTVNKIVEEIQVLVKNKTGRQQLSAAERSIAVDAVVDAYQLVITEYGVSNFRFHEEAVTMTTTASQNYVDLDEYVYRLINGTVRIASENRLLTMIDEAEVYQNDPNLDETGVPTSWAYTASDDPNIIRIILYPTPNSTLTIAAKALKFPTDVITNFPISLQSAIKNKAKALALPSLGLPELQVSFERIYEDMIEKIKDGYQNDGPRHIGRRRLISRPLIKEE